MGENGNKGCEYSGQCDKTCALHTSYVGQLDKHDLFHNEHYENNREVLGRIAELSESTTQRIAEVTNYSERVSSDKAETCHQDTLRLQERFDTLLRTERESRAKEVDKLDRELQIELKASAKSSGERLNDFKHFLITITIAMAMIISSYSIAVGTGIVKMYGTQATLQQKVSSIQEELDKNHAHCSSEFDILDRRIDTLRKP